MSGNKGVTVDFLLKFIELINLEKVTRANIIASVGVKGFIFAHIIIKY